MQILMHPAQQLSELAAQAHPHVRVHVRVDERGTDQGD
jgi:hypothetical protein